MSSPLKEPTLLQNTQKKKANLELRTGTEVSAYSAYSAGKCLDSVESMLRDEYDTARLRTSTRSSPDGISLPIYRRSRVEPDAQFLELLQQEAHIHGLLVGFRGGDHGLPHELYQ